MEAIDRIVGTLEGVNESLMDVSMGLLSDAISRGDSSRPPDEKRVTQARRSVLKAIESLRQISTD